MAEHNNNEEDKDRGGMTLVKILIFLIVILVIVAVVIIINPDGAAEKVQQVAKAAQLPDDVAKEKADKQLVAENTRLAQSNQKLTQDLADVTKEKEVAMADKVQLNQEKLQLAKDKQDVALENEQLEKSNKDMQKELDSRPRYQKLYDKETGWHISLGGLATMPIDDPLGGITFSALLSVGPPSWQVLTGVGYNMQAGMSVSVGFLYSFGHPKEK